MKPMLRFRINTDKKVLPTMYNPKLKHYDQNKLTIFAISER